MRKSLGRVALYAWLGCAAPAVWAAPGDSPVQCAVTELPDPMSAAAITEAISRLLHQLPLCQTQAPWLEQLGHLLNRQARYAEAADHLERALMLAPELQAAKLDYAIALAGQGDTVAALSLINSLLADADLPAHLRPVLQRQVDRWSAPFAPRKGWQTGGAVDTRLGWDSNLLGSPNLSTLTLTIPGQPVVLPLDETYRPVAGTYLRTDAQWAMRSASPLGAQWQIGATLRHRSSSHSLPQTTSSQYEIQAERTSRIAGAANFYLGANISGLDVQAGTRYQALGWALGYEHDLAGGTATGGCQLRAGLELQDRNYASNPLLSGVYRGLAGAWSCQNPLGFGWYMALKTGLDTASSAERAGGDQAQTNFRLVGQWLAPSAWAAASAHFVADLELGHSQDHAGYSPLLENGAPRTLLRQAARLEYRQSLRPDLQWAVGAEWAVQQANLPLFDTRSWSPYATLRWFW